MDNDVSKRIEIAIYLIALATIIGVILILLHVYSLNCSDLIYYQHYGYNWSGLNITNVS